jgi:hypothetical protein
VYDPNSATQEDGNGGEDEDDEDEGEEESEAEVEQRCHELMKQSDVVLFMKGDRDTPRYVRDEASIRLTHGDRAPG